MKKSSLIIIPVLGLITTALFFVFILTIYIFQSFDKTEQTNAKAELELTTALDDYFTELENAENTYIDTCRMIRDSVNDIFLRNIDHLSDERGMYYFEELLRADSLFTRRKHEMK